MRVEKVEDLFEGMVLGENVYIEGKKVLYKCDILDNSSIDFLRNRGIDSVLVFDVADYKSKILCDSEFAKEYLDFFVTGFRGMVISSMFNKEEFSDLSNRMHDYLDRHKYILYDLLKLRCSHCYTYEHSINVALYAMLVGIKLGLSSSDLNDLIVGALLHEMGKLRISNHILDKPGRLNTPEFDAIKLHPEYGVEYALDFGDVSWNVKRIILEHHEKLDGSGYPSGKKDNEILFLSKIITVCDIYDAVTSKRSYHDAKSPHIGVKILREDAENGKLDKTIVEAFISQIAVTPINTRVVLNNGEVCTVIKDDSREKEPIVFSLETGLVYNLENREDLWIEEIQ